MAIAVNATIASDRQSLILTASSGVSEVTELHLYRNDLETEITQTLLASPGFVGTTLTITAADLPEIFDGDGILLDGVYVFVALEVALPTNQDIAVAVHAQEIDCCLGQAALTDDFDPKYEERMVKGFRVFMLLNGARLAAENKDAYQTKKHYDTALTICRACCKCERTVA